MLCKNEKKHSSYIQRERKKRNQRQRSHIIISLMTTLQQSIKFLINISVTDNLFQKTFLRKRILIFLISDFHPLLRERKIIEMARRKKTVNLGMSN